MRAALSLALLLVMPGVAAQALLVAVAPDLPGSGSGDEGFAIGCTTACDLTGWTVTDGEGSMPFPGGMTLPAAGVAWFTANATAWSAFDGPSPAGLVPTNGPKLANDGDNLILRRPDGSDADAFAYGDATTAGMTSAVTSTSAGRIYARDGTPGVWLDTDNAKDWMTPRDHRIGESNLDRPTWSVPRITAYASPDSTYATLVDLVQQASLRLHLHVYELRSIELTDALVASKTAHPGLDLAVSVDASPVGQSLDERHATADALRRIQQAGGHVVLAAGRYDDYHLKVLVADDAVAVQSENWVSSGVPVDPSTGNRGWGVILHAAEAANWFASWMAQDRAAWDAKAFDLATYDPAFEAPGRAAPRTGSYGPRVAAQTFTGPFTVRPLVAPDHTQDPRADVLAGLLDRATRRVDVQQLDLASGAKNAIGWSSDDPLVAGLERAAARHVAVRVQAAAPFASTDEGNSPELARLARAGVATDTMDRAGIATLHNKGLVVDDTVVVGSMNGNHHSRSENREVDLVIEGAPVADYFEGLFDADWDGATAGTDWDVVRDDLKGLPSPLWPSLLALLGVVLVRRWS